MSARMDALKKKCPLCSFATFLIYKCDDHVSCPICASETSCRSLENGNNDGMNPTLVNNNYHFCRDCCVLFHFDEKNVHHSLDTYGKLYYASIITKFRMKGQTTWTEDMPRFQSWEACICLLNSGCLEWETSIFPKEDVCCVCFETTTTFTECNHALCVSCRNVIKNKSCPICRKEQMYKTYFQNNENENGNGNGNGMDEIDVDMSMLGFAQAINAMDMDAEELAMLLENINWVEED